MRYRVTDNINCEMELHNTKSEAEMAAERRMELHRRLGRNAVVIEDNRGFIVTIREDF